MATLVPEPTPEPTPKPKQTLSHFASSYRDALAPEYLRIWQGLLDTISTLFSAPSVLLNQSTQGGIEVLVANQHAENPYAAGAVVPRDCNIYCHQVVSNNEALYVANAADDPAWQDNPEYTEDNLKSYLGLPLNWPDGRVFGTLCVMDRQQSDYNARLVGLLTNFKTVIETQLELVEQNRQLRALSMTDELTQLYNRRGLMEAGQQMMALAQRTNMRLLAVYLDVDNLKPANDTFGHEVGDQLIQACAKIIKTVMRAQDVAARVGGDEFVLLALVDDERAAEAMTSRLKAAAAAVTVSASVANNQQNLGLSVSIGYAAGEAQELAQLEAIIDAADSAMYQVKRSRKE